MRLLGVSLVLVISFIWCCSAACNQPRVRKSWASMTDAERNLFIDALKLAYSNGDYATFVDVHTDNFDLTHGTSLFLPWHRWFLWVFENYLRSLGSQYQCVTIPYWQSESTALLGTSYLFSSTSFGSRYNGCVPDGFVRDWRFGSSCVRRSFPSDISICGEVCTQRVISTYPTYGSSSGFRANYEANPHASPHNWIGGTMAADTSARDPMFFLHHSNVDRMWAIWQDCHDHDTLAMSSYGSNQYNPSSGLDTGMPYGNDDYFSKKITPRMMGRIQSNTLVTEMSYSYADTNMRGIMNDNFGDCNWNWAWPQQSTTPPPPPPPQPQGPPPPQPAPSGGMCPKTTSSQVAQVVEQDPSGTNRASSSDLEFGYDQAYEVTQVFGIRFQLNVPKGATISSAEIVFHPDYTDSDNQLSASSGSIMETITVENTANSASFSTSSSNPITSRSWVAASSATTWQVPVSGWTSSSSTYRVPVTALVQIPVKMSSWSSGNTIGLRFTPTITGTSGRVATKSATLEVSYSAPCKKRDVEEMSKYDDEHEYDDDEHEYDDEEEHDKKRENSKSKSGDRDENYNKHENPSSKKKMHKPRWRRPSHGHKTKPAPTPVEYTPSEDNADNGTPDDELSQGYLGEYYPPSVDEAGAYYPASGQYCNAKVEEQKRVINSRYSNKSPLERIYLLAVSECIIEEVKRYATDEYIEMMHMNSMKKLFVPICQNITELP